MQHQFIQLKKDGNHHEIYYENDDTSFDLPLEEDEYSRIFQKIQPSFSFSTPDKMIQDHIHDGSIFPTFKNGDMFTPEDMFELMKNAKKEMNYVALYNRNCKDNVRHKIKNTTKRNPFQKKQRKRIKRNTTTRAIANVKPKQNPRAKQNPKQRQKQKQTQMKKDTPRKASMPKQKLPAKKYKNKSKNK